MKLDDFAADAPYGVAAGGRLLVYVTMVASVRASS
ncbi:hypothetical protein Spa11_26480 [Botrimarina mediterranea]|uniref:Uncharacterized protein n=1 Tax=Botrimarina mediterranea TaxID=2528022 RepID=A0A518K9H3_9BACT|nr:hypothetical protein Spa11_26480 [Botrimarina mediterranea]